MPKPKVLKPTSLESAHEYKNKMSEGERVSEGACEGASERVSERVTASQCDSGCKGRGHREEGERAA